MSSSSRSPSRKVIVPDSAVRLAALHQPCELREPIHFGLRRRFAPRLARRRLVRLERLGDDGQPLHQIEGRLRPIVQHGRQLPRIA